MPLQFKDIGKGFPVVLVHAFPLDGAMWEPTIPAISGAGFRVIVPDLPGFGKSKVHPEISTMGHFAKEMSLMLDHLGIGSAIFCGLSMGGYALLALYRIKPHLFKGLVLCDTTSEADTEEKKKARFQLTEKIHDEGQAVLVNELLPNLVSESTFDENPQLVKRLSRLINAQPTGALCAALRGMAERPSSNDLMATIDFPVKLIFGSEDKITGAEASKWFQELIRESELTIIEGAGHLSNLEQPKQFNSSLIGYLSSLPLNH